MCYFQYLESNQFIGFKEDPSKAKTFQSFIFGQALENSSSEFEEAILILLEMLRVYFPAGDPITETQSHDEFSKAYLKQAKNEGDR